MSCIIGIAGPLPPVFLGLGRFCICRPSRRLPRELEFWSIPRPIDYISDERRPNREGGEVIKIYVEGSLTIPKQVFEGYNYGNNKNSSSTVIMPDQVLGK